MGALDRLLEQFWSEEFVAEELWLVVGVATLPLMMLAGALGIEALAGIVMIVGWFLVTPLLMFFGDQIAAALFAEDVEEHDENDPLAILRERYARGELTEAEFERRVERLLETESESAPGERDTLPNEAADSPDRDVSYER